MRLWPSPGKQHRRRTSVLDLYGRSLATYGENLRRALEGEEGMRGAVDRLCDHNKAVLKKLQKMQSTVDAARSGLVHKEDAVGADEEVQG